MTHDAAVREHLVQLLRGGHAHISFDTAIGGFPLDSVGIRPEGAPHSAWELLEHMRIAQYDILEFSRSPDYVSPDWPDGYWPPTAAPERKSRWTASVSAFRKDLAEFESMVLDPGRDLHTPFAWGSGLTLLREALLVADHNAYHLGQLVFVKRLLTRK